MHIGDVVVVSGLGVIGSFVAHLCREAASRLVLVDPIAERRDRADWIGADAVVSPNDVEAAIAELSDRRGSDLWFEASGAPPHFKQRSTTPGRKAPSLSSRSMAMRLSHSGWGQTSTSGVSES